MNTIKQLSILLVLTHSLISCVGGTSSEHHTAAGFEAIENELKDKFGTDAHYTDIHISHDEHLGNMVTLTVTEAPESLKMTQWNLAQNAWSEYSEVSLEISEGSKAADFMFQLGDTFSLKQMGALIEKSKTQLQEEKNLDNPKLFSALIKYPKNGDIADAQYNISLKPENGGTTFRFYYQLNGDLIKMDY